MQTVAEFQQVHKSLNTVKNDLKINASDARKSVQELVASKVAELKRKEKVPIELTNDVLSMAMQIHVLVCPFFIYNLRKIIPNLYPPMPP